MNKIKYWQIGAIIFTLIIGTLLHFLYEISGENIIIASFSAVNESVWEHLKLVFFPTLVFAIIEYFFIKEDASNYIISKTIAIVFEIIFITIFFYTYTGIIGTNFAILDIGSFFIAVIVGELIAKKIMMFINFPSEKINIISTIIIVALLIVFVIFTYVTPKINYFKDPITGSYGINKS